MSSLPSPDALRVLIAVVETGSISGAADELHMSQQAASQRIRALEKSLGVAVLERTARGSRLTAAGHLAVQHGRTAVDALDALAAALARRAPSPLTIAASLTIAEHLVPGWLLASGSAANVTVHVGNSAEVADAVRAGAADVGFIESTDVPRDLRAVTLGLDELVAAVAPGDPWARRSALPWAELAERPLVVREAGSGTRRSLDDLLADAGLEPAPPAAELATTAAVRAAAIAGVAPAILSLRAVTDDVWLGRLVLVPLEHPLARPFTALLPAHPTDAARAFVAVAQG